MKKNVLLFLIAFMFMINGAKAQWSLSLDTVGAYLSSSGSNLFAGRSPNGILLSTDTGITWNSVNSGLGLNPNVAALGGNGPHVFTMIDTTVSDHVVYLSADTGANWVADGNGLLNSPVLSFAFHDVNIFAATNGAGIFLSTDSGSNWAAVNAGLTDLIVRTITFNDTNVFAGTKLDGVFLSTDNGANWTAVNNGLTSRNITSLTNHGNNVYAGTNGGGVFLTTDNGVNWTDLSAGLPGLSVKSLVMSGPYIFAAIIGSGIYLSADSGANWTDVNAGLPNLVISALAINNDHLFAGLDISGVWKRPLSDMGVCSSTSSTLNDTACGSYTSPSGLHTWTTSGTYTDIITNAGLCDSIITIHLIVNNVNASVTQHVDTLIAAATGATYQWLNCNLGYAPIALATGQSYVATAIGNYAVRVSQNGCVDTSVCVNMTSVGIIQNTFAGNIRINPNPSTGNFSLVLGERYSNLKIEITDVTGRLVYSELFDETNRVNLHLNEPAGTYLLNVSTAKYKATFRLIKE